MKAISADGATGSILYCHGLKKYVFRIYDDQGDFVDYDIMHCDLTVTINDHDAYLYTDEEGKTTLDHSPETLGLSVL